MSTKRDFSMGSNRPLPFSTFKDSPFGSGLYQLAGRPQMFGTAGDLEAIAECDSHIVLAARFPGWTWDDTRALWRQAARDLFDADRFRGEDELYRRFHWWRWNDREDEAWEQVTAIYRRLWERTPRHLRDPARQTHPELRYAIEWTEELLAHPRLLRNPCEYEMAMMGLVSGPSRIDEPTWNRFDNAYMRERRRVRGDQSRGLCDIGTDEEWDARRIRPYPQFSFDRVVRGITEVTWRMHELVTGKPRPASATR